MIKHIFEPNFKTIKDTDEKNPSVPNPYIDAKREWSWMIGNTVKAKHNWQLTALISGITNVLLVAGIVLIASQSRYIPYAVKVDNLGNTNFAGLLSKQSESSPLMINALLRRYITTARSVISDTVAQKNQLDFVYHSTTDSARAVLDNYYRDRNPFEIAKNETVEVSINTVLPKSSNTWQIDWTEIHHDLNGHVSAENHFEGLATVSHWQPTTTDDINNNPLGLYITHLSWASQQ